jgi:mutator family transposase
VSDSNVIKLAQPGAFTDSLTEILRNGARALLTQAVEAEVAEFLAKHADLKTETGQQRVVRHGHLPQREIMTGIGPVSVRQPRVRDREAAEGERVRYSPSIVPPYARRSKSLEVLIPVLYLKGISSGDFEEALAALVGKDAPGLSASTIARLKSLPPRRRGSCGPRSMRTGRSAICQQSATSIVGPTASIWRPGSSSRRSASWSSSARRLRARRNSSASPMACARAHNRGVICCSI